jgi:AcrR family transcriptional regulator
MPEWVNEPRKAGRPGRRSNADIALNGPTRDRIFETATILFARQGYNATGIAEIGRAVGLGRGALYHHIQSKDHLLYKISEALVAGMVAKGRHVLALDASPEAKLHWLARDLLDNLAANRAGWTVSLYESRALSEPRRRELIRRRDEYVEIWAEVLADCAGAGLTERVSGLRLGGIVGLLDSTYMWLDPNGKLPIHEVARQYVNLILYGLRPNPVIP